MRRVRNVLIACAAVAMIGVATAPRAEAALILSGRVSGGVTTDVCAVDNDAFVCTWGTQISDQNPTLGILSFGAVPVNIGGLVVAGSIHTSTDLPGLALLTSSSITINNTSGETRTVSVAVSQTDYDGPAGQGDTTGSGTWVTANGSLINMEWYNDDNNEQGAQTPFDRPGVMVNNKTDTAIGTLDSFNFNDPFDIAGTETDFSMTVAFDLTLTPGGNLLSRGMAEVKEAQAPEPTSLTLLGLAFGGLALARRRQRSEAQLRASE